MHSYSTLHEFKQFMGLADDNTSEDARLIAALETASKTIDRLTGRSFMPRRATINHEVAVHDAREVFLRDDLISLEAVSDATGDITLNDVVVLSSNVLRLINGRSFIHEHLSEQAVSVTALWGYCPDYANAWADSGDIVQDGVLSANATTITVIDADGTDATPRFQVGMLLRLENEFVQIIAVDALANTLTVKRGVRGTTALSYTNGTSIEVFQIGADVKQATLQWAQFFYQYPDTTEKTMPFTLLTALDGLRRLRVA